MGYTLYMQSDAIEELVIKVYTLVLLRELNDADKENYLSYLNNNDYDACEKIIREKVPNIEELVKEEIQKRLLSDNKTN